MGAAAPTEAHWAFLSPQAGPLPQVRNQRWVRNPVDTFILARLEREDVAPAPEADRTTLLRRLHLDLIGLPPSPEQVRAFLRDPRPDAYERVVEELLASPHFGERWGRHWLDLARYADTSGYQIDRPRPHAWKFRDWVLESFNRDQPFDEFTVEQIAGDLLPEATLAQKTAAGFHRLTLSNHEDGVDAEEFRTKAKVDRVNVTGTAWLGLTLGCAECHNHKYDPVSQREFFQFYAFFNNADEVDVDAPQPDDAARHEAARKAWQAEQALLKSALEGAQRTNEARVAEWRKRLALHKRGEPRKPGAQAHSFRESTNAPRAAIHVRGDFLRRGEEVAAGTPAVLHRFNPRRPQADRLDLARWLVAPENPLTARVAVNHAWQQLFGRGLVATPEDFGTRGDPPSHPELLDWLAVAFRARAAEPGSSAPALAWSRKALLRLLVTSATYRQASAVRPELAARDPLNTLVARQNRLRVESEILRDLCLSAGGLLLTDLGGPSFRPHMPDDVKRLGSAGAFSWEDSTGPERHRRGFYIYAQRTVPYPTSMTFDQADPCNTTARRERSNSPLQALTLLNHPLFVECAQGLAQRMAGLPGDSTRSRIQQGFELCLARRPARAELDRLEQLHAAQARLDGGTNAWLALAQVLMNLDEFMTRE
ncbi:MAG: hypothetical protein RJA22_1269 [Verrucomicrobiota bacterium]